MYDKGIAGLGSVASAGAFTQIGAQAMWAFLGGFALFAASLAVWRIVPRGQA